MKNLILLILAMAPASAGAYTLGGAPLYLQIPDFNDNGDQFMLSLQYDLRKLSTGAATGGGGSSGTVAFWVDDNFLGQVDGATDTFTLSATPSQLASIHPYLDGRLLSSTSDFTWIQPKQVRLTTAPASDSSSFHVIYTTGAPAASLMEAATNTWSAGNSFMAGTTFYGTVDITNQLEYGSRLTGLSTDTVGGFWYYNASGQTTSTGCVMVLQGVDPTAKYVAATSTTTDFGTDKHSFCVNRTFSCAPKSVCFCQNQGLVSILGNPSTAAPMPVQTWTTRCQASNNSQPWGSGVILSCDAASPKRCEAWLWGN